MKTLSVIILNYNTKDLLRGCLQSVCQQADEVIVVDNASADGSVEMVEKFKVVKLIVNKRNLGFAAGNNLGIKQAGGKYILLLNSDTVVKPGAFKKAVAFMNQHSQVGALTPKTLLTSGKLDPDCHRGFPTPWASICYFLGLEKLFPHSRLFGQYHKFYLDLGEIHEIDAGSGAFLLTRRKVIEKIGALDEKYFFYGEDLDFYYRVKQAGWQVMFYPQVLLTHYKGASSGLRKESKTITRATRATRLRTARASIKAMEIFYKKFYQDKYPDWVTGVVIWGIKIKGAIRLFTHWLRK